METVTLAWYMKLHVEQARGVMLVGNAGTGKTTIIKDYLSTLDTDKILSSVINMNS